MSVKRVPPDEAARLLEDGWQFVDVRSIPEFDEGHPPGAYNVPFMHRDARGMQANPRFVEVMERRFAEVPRLVLGCRSGGRSLRACEVLQARGWKGELVDMRGGFAGEHTAGQLTCEGWESQGLPVAFEAESGHSYRELEEE